MFCAYKSEFTWVRLRIRQLHADPDPHTTLVKTLNPLLVLQCEICKTAICLNAGDSKPVQCKNCRPGKTFYFPDQSGREKNISKKISYTRMLKIII